MNLQLQQTAAGPGQNSNAEVGKCVATHLRCPNGGARSVGKAQEELEGCTELQSYNLAGVTERCWHSVRTVVDGYTSFHPPDKSPNLGWSNTDLGEMRMAQNPGRGRNSKEKTRETIQEGELHWNVLWIRVPASCSCSWLYNTWCHFQIDLIYQGMYNTS